MKIAGWGVRVGGGKFYFMKKKILTLAAVVTLPFILLVMYLLASMASYSNTYGEIVSNMTVANNYNLNFKEEMDESLYKLVVGYVTLETIETDKSLKNPYTLIEELRSEFTRLTAITTESESKLWLESLLRNINTLEKRVDDIPEHPDQQCRSDLHYSWYDLRHAYWRY